MHTYTYRANLLTIEGLDLTGYDVEAEDGHIGKVDSASYDELASCLVVDTGFWIFGKKRMIPAGVVDRVDPDQRKLYVAMTKDQIKDAPDYDDVRHKVDELNYHDEVGRYYDPYISRTIM
jgi:hypothetical protein